MHVPYARFFIHLYAATSPSTVHKNFSPTGSCHLISQCHIIGQCHVINLSMWTVLWTVIYTVLYTWIVPYMWIVIFFFYAPPKVFDCHEFKSDVRFAVWFLVHYEMTMMPLKYIKYLIKIKHTQLNHKKVKYIIVRIFLFPKP